MGKPNVRRNKELPEVVLTFNLPILALQRGSGTLQISHQLVITRRDTAEVLDFTEEKFNQTALLI